jgi:8-oxo-dGTP pyrophosphatase MutT (NUDIX family)
MVERSSGMAFAGGALVFPGGRIDDADRQLAAMLGNPELANHVAAIRETLEETGISVGLSPQPSPDEALDHQQTLLAGTPFGDLLGMTGLTIDPAALTPFARWIPESGIKRRFDTLFLIAQAPPGDWVPNPQPGECSAALWTSAAEVLERADRGEARIIFPTRRNLERLALHGSFAAIAADAAAFPVLPIVAWIEEAPEGKVIRIPDGIGYPVTWETIDGLWRG